MKLKTTLIAFFSCALLFSQNFLEVQLPTPEKLSPLFIGPLVKSTIHYGTTPSNYNGKVIIFNHGYIDLNQGQFLFDNSFYQDTYDEGYQAVFVATTRGKGIWVNGELLAEAIDIVTNKYNVPQVYLVGHSNGGKASEAAMFRYGKNNKITKAFALGTPFWGTYLANISQFPPLRWAWSLTGLNEGARTSTTYYCRDVVRPYLDNHPDNDPEKFVVLGASGFYKGSTIAAAAFLLTGGVLLPVQGANDGVAPYRSTLRPGAEYVFRKNDPRAIIDHLDVGLGQFSWSYVKQYIENPTLRTSLNKQNEITNHSITESNYYLLFSDNEYDQVTLDKGSKSAVVHVLHEKKGANFQGYTTAIKKEAPLKKYHTQDHQTSIPITKGGIRIKSDSKYVAFVRQSTDLKMYLEKTGTLKTPILRVKLLEKNTAINYPTQVRGIITKTAEIDGTSTGNEYTDVIEFEQKENYFEFNTSTLTPGVYNLFLNAESEGNFKRSIISGFVVGDIKEALAASENENPDIKTNKIFSITPSLVKNKAQLNINRYSLAGELLLNIYDLTGKKVKNFTIVPKYQKQFDISNQLQTLSKGMYLLKVNDFQTIKFVKN
ncbi:alpha/beta hydrolase [Aquimarina sp. 2304DJ70-9]|uniref:alpha/beta hydrolase n=1 Tax=Aquimarina penaris TaxID=3231044 RepID=UPI00346234EE